MRTVMIAVFVLLMVYVAWWLIRALRARVAFEAEMGLGVGSLWAASFAPVLLEALPRLVPRSSAVSVSGWALICCATGMLAMAVLSLRREGRPAAGWEETTRLTQTGIHSLVRHPMQLSGILAACGVMLVDPTLLVLILGTLSLSCFALGARAEDRFNLAKFGAPYRAYMDQVPALNLPVGVWKRLRARTVTGVDPA